MPHIDLPLGNIAQMRQYSLHSIYDTHIRKSRWIKQQENNATSVSLAKMLQKHTISKQDFTASRI